MYVSCSKRPIAVPQFDDDSSSSDDDESAVLELRKDDGDDGNNSNGLSSHEPPETGFQWGNMDEIQQLTHANAQLTDQVSDLKMQVKR